MADSYIVNTCTEYKLIKGDKSRELFLQSKLPLTVLSQVWNLVDVPHDNMLDVTEFVLAMHLLQWHMRGKLVTREIQAIPMELRLPQRTQPRLPPVTVRELRAFRALFTALGGAKGHLDGELARDVLCTSGLCRMQLALVWNLADVDRDACLSSDEFAVACHLVRLLKKGEMITGPINVQSLLPHHLPKTDLTAKQTRVQYLEQLKQKLMALKERKRKEEIREKQRADLWAQRFELLHELLKGEENFDERSYSLLRRVAERSDRTAIVAQRLKREHEQIRQETARVIIEEQKLSHEVTILKETTSTIRAKQKRNSIIKDVDPFHELYELQKDIPHKVHPFHMDRITQPPLSGQTLFDCESSADCAKCDQCARLSREDDGAACLDCPPEQGVHGPWINQDVDQKLLHMTHSFEDNFVDVWCKTPADPEPTSSALRSNGVEREFYFTEADDPVFRTVSGRRGDL
ncbi:hypothetical protein CAPTEDRAFT_198392 [Capitella teleta]|uniref:EH domain-containing protein n=1 Tax=Capitella teleta TaxID=283909 RepID=R7UR40_CAPTE|nr:hypothetical protein CAPTEDRAFT_198392 [Capitella teleta]|eukprot:ELU06407.1 hypothetical protein CAPTEDRAFT_198392 [Capitella teleta]